MSSPDREKEVEKERIERGAGKPTRKNRRGLTRGRARTMGISNQERKVRSANRGKGQVGHDEEGDTPLHPLGHGKHQ